MQITDNARDVLKAMLEEKNMNAIVFASTGEGMNTQITMDIAAVSEPDMIINGLNVMMDHQTFVLLQDIGLDYTQGSLVLYNLNAGSCGCGCGSSCGDDDSCGCTGCSGCC
ncbi:MAG: hypothetical protein HUJ53_08730 [Holdemanella sp.]|nr:hypothetical protein [Holdemanella sp.]